MAMGHAAARATWLWKEDMPVHGTSAGHEQERERELGLFGAHRWLLRGLSPHPDSLPCSWLFQWHSACGFQSHSYRERMCKQMGQVGEMLVFRDEFPRKQESVNHAEPKTANEATF